MPSSVARPAICRRDSRATAGVGTCREADRARHAGCARLGQGRGQPDRPTPHAAPASFSRRRRWAAPATAEPTLDVPRHRASRRSTNGSGLRRLFSTGPETSPETHRRDRQSREAHSDTRPVRPDHGAGRARRMHSRPCSSRTVRSKRRQARKLPRAVHVFRRHRTVRGPWQHPAGSGSMYCARILVRRHKVISEVDMVGFELGPIVNRRYSAVFAAAAGPSLNELGQLAVIHAVPSCAAGGGVLSAVSRDCDFRIASKLPTRSKLSISNRSSGVNRACLRLFALARVFAFDLQNPIEPQNCAGNLRTQTRLRTNHPFPKSRPPWRTDQQFSWRFYHRSKNRG